MASNSKEEDGSEVYSWDLLWSLFMVALKSYRFDSVLRPFPPSYLAVDTKEKDVDNLRRVAEIVPPIKDVLKNDKLPLDALNLFQWVTEAPTFRLVHQSLDQFDEILKLTKQEFKTCLPHQIFKVIHSQEREERFQKAVNGQKTLYAYHGSSLENFHSILHNGLAWHLSKEGLFGSGTYLSNELSVCLHYSFGSNGWSKSLLGSRLSCVAVCEFVKDDLMSLCGNDGNDVYLSSSLNDPKGKLPEKYYIVQNNDLVQVRYLLVYSYGDMTSKQCTTSWWRKNWILMFSICYVIFLVLIGLSKSTNLKSLLNFIHR